MHDERDFTACCAELDFPRVDNLLAQLDAENANFEVIFCHRSQPMFRRCFGS